MMKVRATEIEGMVYFDGPNVEIAGLQSFSFFKVIRLIQEARRIKEKSVYTIEAIEVMLHLNETDVNELLALGIDEAAVYDEVAVIKVSQNLYITEKIQIQYNYNLLEYGISDEEYVDRVLAEQEHFDKLIYGCDTSEEVAEGEVEE